MGLYGKLNNEQLAFAKALLQDPKADGHLKALANLSLGGHLERVGKYDEAAKFYAQVGFVDTWQMVGEFDNISASGFDKNYPPIQQPEATAEFVNREGAKVKWFSPPAVRNDGWIDFDYHLRPNNAIVFAQTFVNSPADQALELRFGVSGSLKVWLNDAPLASIAEERNTSMDVYNYPTTLRKGFNRILVQVGESELNNSNFMLRITDKTGHNLSGLSYSAEYKAYGKETAPASAVAPLPDLTEQFFSARAKAATASLFDKLVLAEAFLQNDKRYEARKVLHEAYALAPDNSFIAARLIDAFNRDENRTEAAKMLEDIRSKDPDALISVYQAMSDATEKEDYDELERQIVRLETLYGKDEKTELQRMRLLATRKQYDEMLKLVNDAYERYPDQYELVSMRSMIEKEVYKNPRAAIAVIEKYLKNNANSTAVAEVSSAYIKLGNPDKGLKTYAELLERYPYAVGYFTKMAKTHFGLRNYQQALEYQQKALALAPYIGDYWNEVGLIYEQMGKEAEAKEAYLKAVTYEPSNYEVRKKLRKLNGQKDIYSYFTDPDVYGIFNRSPKAEKNSGESSAILHQEVQHIIYPGGGSEERYILVAKVLNNSGIDIWKEYSIDYNENTQRLIVEKSEVLKANGSKLASESNGSFVVFTNLEVGDAIHLTYRLENYGSGKLANHFWGKFHLNYFIPANHVKYNLLLPQDRQFKHLVTNTTLAPEIKPVDEFLLHVWEKKNQPKIASESNMPPLSDVGEALHLSSLPDWNFVANWYSDLANTKARGDFEVKEAVAQLFEGKTSLDDTQKARTIYEYIVRNIRYSSTPFRQSAFTPQRASRTLSTKLGDCKDVSTLFVAMAREVGLKANLVLIDTRDNGQQDLSLPSIGFNHCIARVNLNGQEQYLELTDVSLPFATATSALKGAISLNIPRNEDKTPSNLKLLSWSNRPRNAQVLYTHITFENNDMLMKRKVVRNGLFAAMTRGDNADISPEDQEKGILQSVSGIFNTPVKLQSLKFDDNLHTVTDSLSFEYALQVKNNLTEIGGLKIMNLPWREGERSAEILSEEERKFPLNYWHYDVSEYQKEVMTIQLPKGKVLAEVPKSQQLSYDGWQYRITYKQLPGKLVVTRETTYTRDAVEPANYAKFKAFFNQMLEADTKKLAFK
jgi:tetratricopeptide (TPR) repeat protein